MFPQLPRTSNNTIFLIPSTTWEASSGFAFLVAGTSSSLPASDASRARLVVATDVGFALVDAAALELVRVVRVLVVTVFAGVFFLGGILPQVEKLRRTTKGYKLVADIIGD